MVPFISNRKHFARIHQPIASYLIAIHRMHWYGNVLCLSPTNPPTRALLSFDATVVSWKRPCGRPCTRWLGVIEEDLQGLDFSLEDAEEMAWGCWWWRALVNQISSIHIVSGTTNLGWPNSFKQEHNLLIYLFPKVFSWFSVSRIGPAIFSSVHSMFRSPLMSPENKSFKTLSKIGIHLWSLSANNWAHEEF